MKTIALKALAIGIVVSTLLLTSCGKDGATGPAGATGPQGIAGNNGTNGTNGSANVTVQTLTVSTWNYSTTYSNYFANLGVSALTLAVQDSGVVEVFYSIDNGTDWNGLPCTINAGNPNFYTMSVTTEQALVQINWYYFGTGTGTDPNTALGVSSIQYKVVTIPPAARRANPNLNLHDFSAIKKAFKL